METLTQTVQSLLEQAVARREVAGMSVLVLHKGQELVYADAGWADKAAGMPFQRDTLCRIYSMSKPVTAAAAMLLVERGQLDLGAWLGSILPAWQNMQVWENGKKVPARRNILVKDLMNMTSGISYPGMDASGQEVDRVFDEGLARLYGQEPMTTRELADRLGDCGLAFHPGDQWMYGSSADILGAVIEEVSGMPFGEFLKREIFEPLGMTDTGFFVPEGKRHRMASVYRWAQPEMEPVDTDNLMVSGKLTKEPAFQSGGAGLISTVDDYAKFGQSLLGYGPRILKDTTLEYMTRGRLLPWQRESLWRSWESMAGYNYSNLMRVLEEPGMALLEGWKGEYGWDGWLGTYFCNSPENDTTVLMFCQKLDAGTMEITRKIRNVIAVGMEECV